MPKDFFKCTKTWHSSILHLKRSPQDLNFSLGQIKRLNIYQVSYNTEINAKGFPAREDWMTVMLETGSDIFGALGLRFLLALNVDQVR